MVTHVHTGLQDLTCALASLTDRAVTHDAARYWITPPDDRYDDPVPHILWLRRTASAYRSPSGAVQHLRDVATVALAGVGAAPAGGVEFQGKVLTTADFVATWVTELAVHQLDLAIDPGPAPPGAALARRTLEALAGTDLPPSLDDVDAVQVGLGRQPWPDHLGSPGPFPIGL